NLNDSGDGSLRDALQYAAANNKTKIIFSDALANTDKTITLSSSLTITKGITIDGKVGTEYITVKGNGEGGSATFSVFTVTASNSAVAFNNIGITYGLKGVEQTLNSVALTFSDAVVSYNSSDGVNAKGSVTVTNSAIHHNAGDGIVTTKSANNCLDVTGTKTVNGVVYGIDHNGGFGIHVNIDADRTVYYKDTTVNYNGKGGIVAKCHIVVENCVVSWNGERAGVGEGDGIHTTWSVKATDSAIYRNIGNGIYSESASGATVTGHKVVDGVAYGVDWNGGYGIINNRPSNKDKARMVVVNYQNSKPIDGKSTSITHNGLGGVYSTGYVQLANATISDNGKNASSASDGYGVHFEGMKANNASVITQVLITGNQKGGVYAAAINATSGSSVKSSIKSSTIADNGGYGVETADDRARVTVVNSIIVRNGSEDVPTSSNVTATYTLSGHSFSGIGNQIYNGTDPLFVETEVSPYEILASSKADGAGNPSDVNWDYDLLGNPRRSNNGAKTSLGVFEKARSLEAPSIVVTTLDDVVNPCDDKISLREAIEYYFADPSRGDYDTNSTITF
ncbi:MAG: right-handed parallel beta-helix repeat-containing protein, partial [Muribaculaceae bacterium]|nr:right-handed parallel beta-helix repeat-containing protein [Muribaculaceae bacterium]